MGKVKNKTTAKHFEIFKAECEKWIEIFGLKGWEVRYEHCIIGKDTVKADCIYSVIAKHCVIRLTKKYPHNVTLDSLKRSAFHEVCEMFLGELVILAEYRYTTQSEIEAETHTIIRTLENVLWKGR